jgi:hypothetical protein
MKYSSFIGIIAALGLIATAFIPWTFYPDIHKNFTGFFSEQNAYGKPGKALIFFSIIAIALFVIPKIWAKRANIFLGAVTIAYCIKCFILFTSCYNGICPEKRAGVILILIWSALILIAALSPALKLKNTAPKSSM